jgi:hypothetical protein
MDWAAFQICLDDRFPGNSVVVDEVAVEKGVEELTAASVPRRRPRADPWPLFPLVFRIKYA